MKFRVYRAIPVLMAALALPAFAQFEVSPDHFDETVGESSPTSNSYGHARIEQQLAANRAQLSGYRKQIKTQVALVEQARQKLNSLVASTQRTAASITLQARQRELEVLQRSLAGPIRYARATIASLKTERRSMATAELRPGTPLQFVGGSPERL